MNNQKQETLRQGTSFPGPGPEVCVAPLKKNIPVYPSVAATFGGFNPPGSLPPAIFYQNFTPVWSQVGSPYEDIVDYGCLAFMIPIGVR